MTDTLKNLVNRYDDLISTLQAGLVPVLLLFCRLWVAWVFFNSGLIKSRLGIAHCIYLSWNTKCQYCHGSWRLT